MLRQKKSRLLRSQQAAITHFNSKSGHFVKQNQETPETVYKYVCEDFRGMIRHPLLLPRALKFTPPQNYRRALTTTSA